MSNLVFLSGDFCSGSTLLFTLFRHTGAYHCLYEPLHELLPEYLIWPLRTYEHHFYVRDYFEEYRGFRRIPALFDSTWGTSRLYLPAEAQAPELYRYLSYLIDTALTRRTKVLLKFNRVTFRLPWLRAHFPQATVVHIWRAPGAQWRSVVRRGQAHLERTDIGQDSPAFNGFNIARWCDDLQTQFPELAVANSRTGYERFHRLWELSRGFNQRYADLSLSYESLIGDFDDACTKLSACVGEKLDATLLRQYVVPPTQQTALHRSEPRWQHLIDRAGRRYAHLRAVAARRWRSTLRSRIAT